MRKPIYESIVIQIDHLTEDYGLEGRRQPGHNVRMERLEIAAREVAFVLKKADLPKNVKNILAAWTHMKQKTGFELDFDVTDSLEALLTEQVKKQEAALRKETT